ncbi:MAG: glycosyltransferase [Bacteroidaceae bacterium]|nr:glycosyltransferase [Bacteroidaceae bacterium]
MKILIVTALNITPFCGGIERFALELGKRFSFEGHNVKFISFKERKDVEKEIQQCYFPKSSKYDCAENERFLHSFILENEVDVLFNQQADSLDIVRLCDAARKETKAKLVSVFHFDPMHYVDIYRASFSDIFSAGLSIGETINLLFHNMSLFRKIQIKKCGSRYSKVYELSDAVVLLSEKAKPAFLSMASIEDASKLYAISNPITNRHTKNQECTKDNLVVFVGRLNFLQKRPDLLLKVWERIYENNPSWRCAVVGNGEYYEIMQKKIRKNSVKNIELVGFADSEDYYKKAKILCMTSNSEGFPLVITEASSYGVVPIAFDSFNAVSDVIKDEETGLIVPAFDVDTYAVKLHSLMNDNGKLSRLSNAATIYTEKFNMDRIVLNWYELFESLL